MWVPALNIFETSLRRGKFDESRKLSNGSLMEFAHVYPMDAVFDTLEDVPQDVSRGDGGRGREVVVLGGWEGVTWVGQAAGFVWQPTVGSMGMAGL